MRDYLELVKALRYCANNSLEDCESCPRTNAHECNSKDMVLEEADAIEELQGKLKELYRLTCDINKNEINAQIEWGNLDNFLRAFRKYADKIAGVELPDPPKGVE